MTDDTDNSDSRTPPDIQRCQLRNLKIGRIAYKSVHRIVFVSKVAKDNGKW